MDRERLEASLEGIRHLLSHLHGEITDLEESYSQVLLVLRKLEGACEIDDLTKLMRRRPFFQKWQTLLDECQQLNESCGVLMIDIDHFKKINDTYGHQTGDEVIKGVAGLLKQYEAQNCVVGRYGGEEFAIAIKGSDAEVLGIAEFIRKNAQKLRGPVVGSQDKTSNEAEWKCTLSLGMASTQREGYDATRLLKVADRALYEAKNGGRNQVKAA